MKRIVVLDLAEEIHDYVGDVPEGSWDYDAEIMEYGTPNELAMTAAYTFFGEMGDRMADDPNEALKEELGACAYNEPHDQYYFDVLHSLTVQAPMLQDRGLVHLTDIAWAQGKMILELSTEMDMSKRRERIEPPTD